MLGVQSWIKQAAYKPEFLRMIENLTAFQRRFEQAIRTPEFLRGIESIFAAKKQIEQAICKPEFRRVIENLTAFQKQIEQTRLPASIAYYGRRVRYTSRREMARRLCLCENRGNQGLRTNNVSGMKGSLGISQERNGWRGLMSGGRESSSDIS